MSHDVDGRYAAGSYDNIANPNHTDASTMDDDSVTGDALTTSDDPTTDDIAIAEKEATAVDLLRQVHARHGDRVALSCSFGGPGGMVLAHMAHLHQLPFTVVFIDTGFLFPETYALQRHVTREWHLNVHSVQPDMTPEEQQRVYGPALWRTNPNECCRLRKTEPMARALQPFDCWISALRRDQSRTRARVNPVETHVTPNGRRIAKVHPLFNWHRQQVWHYIHRHNVPYNTLLDDGYTSIGCVQCTARPSDDQERSGRWQGFAKTECGLHTFTKKSDSGQA